MLCAAVDYDKNSSGIVPCKVFNITLGALIIIYIIAVSRLLQQRNGYSLITITRCGYVPSMWMFYLQTQGWIRSGVCKYG